MVKLRLMITAEYEADPKNYGTDDPEKMAAIDNESHPLDLLGILYNIGVDVRAVVVPASK